MNLRGSPWRVVDEARAHLGAALAQALPSDDQIIMQHVRDAYALLHCPDESEPQCATIGSLTTHGGTR